jgi:hypothetical protein
MGVEVEEKNRICTLDFALSCSALSKDIQKLLTDLERRKVALSWKMYCVLGSNADFLM